MSIWNLTPKFIDFQAIYIDLFMIADSYIFIFSRNQHLTLTIYSEAIKMQTIDKVYQSIIKSDKAFRSRIVMFFLYARLIPPPTFHQLFLL